MYTEVAHNRDPEWELQVFNQIPGKFGSSSVISTVWDIPEEIVPFWAAPHPTALKDTASVFLKHETKSFC